MPLIDRGLLDLMIDSVDIDEADDVELLVDSLSSVVGTDWETTFRRAFSWFDISPKLLSDIFLSELDWRFGFESKYLDVLLASQAGPTISEMVRIWDRDGLSLIHTCFFLSGGICEDLAFPARPDAPSEPDAKKHANQWHQYIRQVMEASDDVHRRIPILSHLGISDAISPFCALLLQFTNVLSQRRQVLERGVRKLAAILAECNIDLLTYGQAEAAIIAAIGEERRLRGEGPLFKLIKWSSRQTGSGQGLYLRELHCGPQPEDWRLEWAFIYDNEELCGDFWRLVEGSPIQAHAPPLAIPGAWPEDWDG